MTKPNTDDTSREELTRILMGLVLEAQITLNKQIEAEGDNTVGECDISETLKRIDQHTKTMCERAVNKACWRELVALLQEVPMPTLSYDQVERRIAELESSPNKREDSDAKD